MKPVKRSERDCLVPGCGAIPFKKVIAEFSPRSDLLAPATDAMLYEQGVGRLRSALDLPAIDEGHDVRSAATANRIANKAKRR